MQPSSKLYLWEKRTLYLGVINEPIHFVQPASSIAFSLDEPIKLTWNNKQIETRSFLLPPGQVITGNTGNSPVAICMLDPLGYDYTAMSGLMKRTNQPVKYEIENENGYIKEFTKLYNNELSVTEVYTKLNALLVCNTKVEHTIDPRILRVIELIHEHVEDNISIDCFANEVGVSSSRLFQLFKEQVGAPIRRYRLWHRLFCATREIARTNNLAAGAHTAGFSDAAHFHRTFKRMIGMTPTDLFSQPNGLRIYI